ncbi:MAG: hypothetical protein AAB337_00325 [Patescibacteria group bacterium]
METQQQTGGWYNKLATGLETIAEQLQIDGDERLALREFVMAIAREQYKAGNRAGIKWLRIQMNKQPQATG